MFWMRAYPLRGEVGGGWALEFESFLGPVKWHRADIGECHLGLINYISFDVFWEIEMNGYDNYGVKEHRYMRTIQEYQAF